MENKTIQFKTTINCAGCIAAVKPHLDKVQGIKNWDVDTSSKDKILTVSSAGITQQRIIETVQKAGFSIEVL